MNCFIEIIKKPLKLVILTSVILGGCQFGPEQLIGSKYIKEVFVHTGLQSLKIDIIWVVDNSGSMGNDQAALANNFDGFINHFLQDEIDFKMAIITTDNHANKDTEGKLTLAYAKEDQNSFKDYFKEKIRVGTNGSYDEKGLLVSKNFLDANTSWSRENAYLVIIYVSDENDHSSDDVSHYVSAIQGVKNNAGKVKLCTITNSLGGRYKDAAGNTNGLIADINQSFSTLLDDFGTLLSSLCDNCYPLSYPAKKSSITINVNGGPSPEDRWTYDSDAQTVSFNIDYVPSVGQKVEIVYMIAKPGEEEKKDLDEE